MRGNASPGEPRSAVVAAIIFQVIVTQALKTGNKERIDQMSRRAIAEERSEWHSRAMLRPGKRNLITDVDGIGDEVALARPEHGARVPLGALLGNRPPAHLIDAFLVACLQCLGDDDLEDDGGNNRASRFPW